MVECTSLGLDASSAVFDGVEATSSTSSGRVVVVGGRRPRQSDESRRRMHESRRVEWQRVSTPRRVAVVECTSLEASSAVVDHVKASLDVECTSLDASSRLRTSTTDVDHGPRRSESITNVKHIETTSLDVVNGRTTSLDARTRRAHRSH